MYTHENFKTKKALREVVEKHSREEGRGVTIYAPGLGTPKKDGIEFLEGPHYPEPHRWYAKVEMKDGLVVRVIK